jgi:hypothetical protein
VTQRLRKWLERWFAQYVMGDSPPAPHRAWSSLKAALEKVYGTWSSVDAAAKSRHFDRMKRDFDDETKQIEWCFNKLGVLMGALGIVLTVAGVIVAVAPGRFHRLNLWTVLAATLLVVAFLLDGWGLVARAKIYRKLKDPGLAALVVPTGDVEAKSGQEIDLTDPIDADIWRLYLWAWHRSHMHNAIEKLFTGSWITLAGAVVLALVGVIT